MAIWEFLLYICVCDIARYDCVWKVYPLPPFSAVHRLLDVQMISIKFNELGNTLYGQVRE